MTYASEVAADSPVGWWRLGEASGSVAVDASGNGLDGAYNGSGDMDFTTLGLNQSSLIDGDSDTAFKAWVPGFGRDWFLDLPDDPALHITTTTDMSVDLAWQGTDLLGPMVVAWGQFMIYLSAGVPQVRRTDGVSTPLLAGTKFVADGQRHHIVLEAHRDAGAGTYLLRLSVDGTVDAQMSSAWHMGTPSSWRIGHTSGGFDDTWLFGVNDELAIYDHLLGPDRIRAHWHAAFSGSIWAESLDLGLAIPPAHVVIGQAVAAVGLGLGLAMGQHSLRQPVRLGSVNDTDDVPGVIRPDEPGAIYLAPVVDPDDVPGIYIAPSPADMTPIYLAPVSGMSVVPGVWIPRPASNPTVPIVVPVPVSPTYPAGEMVIDGEMAVAGVDKLTAAACRPKMNATGDGSYTHKGAVPAIGSTARFTVAGEATMTGLVTATSDRTVDSREESGQLQSATISSTASELAEVLVLPEWGAMDTDLLGRPTQDVRVWDWTQNGLGDWSGDEGLYTPGHTPVPQMMASGVDVLAADEPLGGPWNSAYPLPDVWPDNSSQWINWISPRIPAPPGWALFRVATPPPPPGKVQLWLCAWDYAELWCDGVKLVTCNTPGKAEHIEIEDMKAVSHLLAMRLYTRGGAAGVMATMLPVLADGTYGPPVVNTRSGWVAIPVHDAFVYTPGAVLQRLFYEARQRHNTIAAKWTLTFTNKNDSDGRPWDVPEWPIETDVGISYLDVLSMLADNYIDWTESPSGWRLNAYRKGEGTGHSLSLPWTAGADLSSMGVAEAVRQ